MHRRNGSAQRHARRVAAAVAIGLANPAIAGCDGPTDPRENGETPPEPELTPDLPYTVAVNRREPVGTTPAITLLRSDGSVEAALKCPACSGVLSDPRWSRDGRMLSVTSRRDTFSVLLVFNRDGTGLREVARVAAIRPPPGKITTLTYPYLYADWSRDGRLLYTRSTTTHTNLETVNNDGSAPRVIYSDTVGLQESGSYRVIVARWGFADGTITANMDERLFAMNADGSDFRPLTSTGIRASRHSWSPDGRNIAFIAAGEAGNTVMTLDVTSGALRTVYASAAFKSVRSYCWSPSSSRFSLTIGEFPASYLTVNADGSGIREQAQSLAAFSPKAVWTPDSRYLIFLVDMGIPGGSHGMQLYRVRLRDREVARVTDLPDLVDYSLVMAEGDSCS